MNPNTSPLSVGHPVTYFAGKRAQQPSRLCRRGVVAGKPVADAYTDTVWIPVRADETAADQEPDWVRFDDIIVDET